MTNIPNTSDLRNKFYEIRRRNVFTDTELSHISAGQSAIRLSRGHILFPILNKDIKEFCLKDAEANYGNPDYKTPYINLFENQVKCYILMNFHPREKDKHPDKETFNGACLYLYICNYIGNFYDIDRDMIVVNKIIGRLFGRIYRKGYGRFRNQERIKCPELFVGKQAIYKCVDYDVEDPTQRRILAVNQRSKDKREIMKKLLSSLKGKKIKTYLFPNGTIRRKFYTEMNKRLIANGHKPYKHSMMNVRKDEALKELGLDLKELYEKESVKTDICKMNITQFYELEKEPRACFDRFLDSSEINLLGEWAYDRGFD